MAVFKSTGAGQKEPRKEYTVSFSKGDSIFVEGELGTEMFIVQEGEVHIRKRLGEEMRTLSVLEKGDFFGEMAVIESQSRSANAIAATDVTLLVINGTRFNEMLRKNPEIAIRIIRKYSRRLREANRLLEMMSRTQLHPENIDLDTTHTAAPAGSVTRRLVELGSGTAYAFSQGVETLIGRADPVTGIRPDIDLTEVDDDRSVSRRHAKIIRHDDGWAMLEEVGTLNGTFVNDEKIQTGVPHPIKGGDRVRIGLVQLKVVYDE